MKDLEIKQAIQDELHRQRDHIELIASENFVSVDILEAVGSVLTNKYAEGYPNARYYGGCQCVDVVESLAISRAKELFHAEHANVQPHSGSSANMGVYMAVLNHGDVVLGMSLSSGGHLTHGHAMNFSGINYKFVGYEVNRETEMIDYDEVLRLAKLHQPKLIVAGASAYSRIIDFAKFRQIADEVGALLMVDMAHIAGLVATGAHPNPVPYADFVTSTTHKTLRGPRGGLILCKQKYAPLLDKKVFPGIQGGPLVHVIAGKAICFKEAMGEEFHDYIERVIANNKSLLKALEDEGFRVISGGSDNHLCLIDVTSTGLSGKQAETILDSINITVNKNTIPYDTKKPNHCSGIRLGSAAMTTRGLNEFEFALIGKWIAIALKNHQNKEVLQLIKRDVLTLLEQFPLYPQISG